MTGGQVYFYSGFTSSKCGEKLYHELFHDITKTFGYEALMRIRTSRGRMNLFVLHNNMLLGFSTSKYFGNFSMTHPDELDIAGIDCDKSLCVQFQLDEKLDEKSAPTIQCALLYVSILKIRLHCIVDIQLPEVREEFECII